MKLSIIVAVVVSIIVSAICTHLLHWNLPETQQTAHIASILLAVVAGLLALAILRMVMTPPPGILVEILAVAAISLLAIWLAVRLLPTPILPFGVGGFGPVVRCNPTTGMAGHAGNFDSGEDDPDRNGLRRGNTLNWHVYGNPGTVVSFEFKAAGSCKGTSPFAGTIPTRTIPHSGLVQVPSGPVNVSEDYSCYHYVITCTMPDNSKIDIDPIIDIPPRRYF
jgi:hypothetical protein